MAQEIGGFGAANLKDDQARPAIKVYAVAPSDSADLTNGPCRALYVGTGGNVVLIARGNSDSESVTLAVADKTVLPIQVRRVKSTSTTASNIFALY